MYFMFFCNIPQSVICLISSGCINVMNDEPKRQQIIPGKYFLYSHWDPLRVNGHLADQKFESRGKLSAKDQSAGVEKIIPLQKGTFWRKFRNLQISVRGTGRNGFLIWHVIAGTGTLQVLFQLLLADAKLFSYLRRI